ncbi:LIC_10091 family protein [Singulisphaera acidiphila]|uniref:DUF7790 domain-containing protein n=1 Tax=Singulisphaera acidiphila (strain ATCC BAA-1392 / DSM 18658 / VKM B-2454 / MOB10) TaxID=886293 RepID=L0DKR6_SINAD|nr:hypothetical protein [Singulisphaera acidiphila]AGA29969.1 hypothetical protein Sinac_5848 [Singulisphaera acidiphila DSM 18658]
MATPPPLADLLFPSRDATFASIIRELSERETGPAADNLVSNEDSYPRVAAEVARLCPPGQVYLGVGPDQNFTILAHTKPRLAFVMDYRRRNLLLHLVHKALFTLSTNRVAYLTRLTARRPGRLASDPSADDLVTAFSEAKFDRRLLETTQAEMAAILQPLGVLTEPEWKPLATIQAKLAGPGMNARFLALPMYPTLGKLVRTRDRQGAPAHLLASEDRYQFVRELQQGDRLIPLVGDFSRPPSLSKVGDWLRAHSLRLALLYVSDVEFFLIRAGRFASYVESLAGLPWAEGAQVVRTSTREIAHPDRTPGDSSTTVLQSIAMFLKLARSGAIKTVEDLFPR